MDFADFLPTFITESHDNLALFEDSLMEISQGDHDTEVIGALFRAVHSIKGGAGMFNAKPIVELAHIAESALDLVRAEKIELSEHLIELLFQTCDVLSRYLTELEHSEIKVEPADENIKQALEVIYKQGIQDQTESSALVNENQLEQPTDTNQLILIIEQNAYMMGLRLEPLILDIEAEHRVTAKSLTYHGPQFSDLNPTECFLKFQAQISPPITAEEADELLSFSAGIEYQLVPVLTAPPTTSNTQIAEPSSAKTDANDNDNAAKPSSQIQKKPSSDKVVKVSSNKLDGLVDEVGELVTLKYQIKSLLESMPDIQRALIRSFDKSIDELRNTALSLRLTAVGESLNRFHRVVREAAKITDKKIALSINGADTELDRVTIEKLIDPLTHIVRNSCDHGIETPANRTNAGKDEVGNIAITASYKGSGVSILIEDDGKGLDKHKILEKAIGNGLVKNSDELSDKEIYRLIFHAGLSTADKVTDLSGRGVGMDVVRKNIEELGGAIEIDSTLGKGTVIEITLPLTTAILNGFAVKAGGTMIVLQTDIVQECIASNELSNCSVDDESCVKLRGDYLPKIDLATALQLTSDNVAQEAIIVRSKDGPVALSVDSLLGELQTVVKPLDPLLRTADAFSGVVKMASGDIGFSLDVNQLVKNLK